VNEVTNESIEKEKTESVETPPTPDEEKAGCFDAQSTPEKVCRSSTTPQSKWIDEDGNHVIASGKGPGRMQGVSWDPRYLRWLVSSRKRGKGSTTRSFSRHRFMTAGRTAEEADEEAMRQAFAFRRSLICEGAVRPYRSSGMKHVHWCFHTGSWLVVWCEEDGKKRTRSFSSKNYMELGMSSEEAKETALWKAVAFRASVLRQMHPKQPKVSPDAKIEEAN